MNKYERDLRNLQRAIESGDSAYLHVFELGNCTMVDAVNEFTEFPDNRFIVNPPPRDGCCDRCGRTMAELPPFGGPGDPLVGDFTGMKLIKFHTSDGAEWFCRGCLPDANRPDGN